MTTLRKMNGNNRKAIISLSIFVLGIVLFPLISYIRRNAGDYNYPPMTKIVRYPALIMFVILFAGYWYYIKARRMLPPFKISILSVISFFALGIFLCCIYPIFSIDLYEYIIRGRIWGIYHANPYVYTPNGFREDLFFNIKNAEIFWKSSTMIYGPVWTYIVSLGSVIFSKSVFLSLFTIKFFLFLFHVVASFFIYKIAKILKLSRPDIPALAYLLNPFILTMTVVDGHMDTVMMSLLIGSLFALFSKKFYLAFFLLSLSIMTKYLPILFLPFYLVYIYENVPDKQDFFKKISISVLIMILTTAVAYAAFWKGFAVFSEARTVMEKLDTCTIVYICYRVILLFGPMDIEFFRHACYFIFGLSYLLVLSYYIFSFKFKLSHLFDVIYCYLTIFFVHFI